MHYDTLFLVRCEGCGNQVLGGTGLPGDPVMSATYSDNYLFGDKPTFICPGCYQGSKKRYAHAQ